MLRSADDQLELGLLAPAWGDRRAPALVGLAAAFLDVCERQASEAGKAMRALDGSVCVREARAAHDGSHGMILRLRKTTIESILIVVIAASIVLEIEQPSDAPRFEAPLILLALLLIVEMVDRVQRRADTIDKTANTIHSFISAPEVRTYPNAAEFYRAMNSALRVSKSSLDLTHIRTETPSDFGAAADGWFDNVRQWVENDDARSARRVIASTSQDVVAWATQMNRELGEVPFYVALTPWPLSIPAVNIAIFDEKRVFVSLPGPTAQRSPGFETTDPLTVRHFIGSFEALWNAQQTEPLKDWLTRQHLDAGSDMAETP
jgi:hypothetical protein